MYLTFTKQVHFEDLMDQTPPGTYYDSSVLVASVKRQH